MILLDNKLLDTLMDYPTLIDRIRLSFADLSQIPPRNHYDFKKNETLDSMLLLMPAWNNDNGLGVKIVAVSPENSKKGLDTINGIYVLFSKDEGIPLAIMDARKLTTRRTAATSALASSYLSRKDSETLLIIGTGNLVPPLIEAHKTVRPIKNVYIWGRNYSKAEQLARSCVSRQKKVRVIPLKTLTNGVKEADIISCATSSINPVLFGELLRSGQHIDLVGSYKPNMRELDDKGLLKTRLFVDTYKAIEETGDLHLPLENKIIDRSFILGTLSDLTTGRNPGRKDPSEITCFKSVGHAVEDLAGATLAFENFQKSKN